MICIGRSNYFRFNHPEEAELVKTILPNARISSVPMQFVSSEPPGKKPFSPETGFKVPFGTYGALCLLVSSIQHGFPRASSSNGSIEWTAVPPECGDSLLGGFIKLLTAIPDSLFHLFPSFAL